MKTLTLTKELNSAKRHIEKAKKEVNSYAYENKAEKLMINRILKQLDELIIAENANSQDVKGRRDIGEMQADKTLSNLTFK